MNNCPECGQPLKIDKTGLDETIYYCPNSKCNFIRIPERGIRAKYGGWQVK
jgi:hypothetical protein